MGKERSSRASDIFRSFNLHWGQVKQVNLSSHTLGQAHEGITFVLQ